MEKIRLNLKEIQAVEYQILERFTQNCERYNIQYVIAWGTLLGAVRHQGFVPWDDDIDVVLPRRDYEKLRELVRDGRFEMKHLKIMLPGMDHYAYPFIKVFDKRTEAEEGSLNPAFENRLWIDVFPLDHIPDSRILSAWIFARILVRRAAALTKTGRYGLKKNCFFKTAAGILYRIYGGYQKMLREIDGIAKKSSYLYKNSVHASAVVFVRGSMSWDFHDYDEFFPRIKLTFENTEFYAPKYYDKNLRKFYGEYMKLPPEEKRNPHHVKAWWTGEKEELEEILQKRMAGRE